MSATVTPTEKSTELSDSDPILTEKEKKKIQHKKEDKEYENNEIKRGIRFKLIILFSILLLTVALGIISIATKNQAKSLLSEKDTQAKIIVRALTSSIRPGLLDIYAGSAKKIKKLNSVKQFKKFYKKSSINDAIYEYVDDIINQPDVVYAYILGKKNIVLAHTNTEIASYSINKFEKGVESYFTSYKKKKLKKAIAIQTKIDNYIVKSERIQKKLEIPTQDAKEPIEILDISYLLSFKNNPELKDGIGEVHLGISLENVNKQIFQNQVDLQLVGLIAIAFGIFIAVIFATMIASPIRRVIEGMQMVSKGDFSASVIVKSKDEVGLMSKTFNVMLQGMSILVSPEVAQKVLEGGDLTESGEKKVVTVLFSDIRAFTTISESLTPKEVVHMLNDYMGIMTDIIIKYGGVVDKFVGDEIFAAFGTPFDHPSHPLCACATAVQMGVDLENHNKERAAEGKPPIRIGIGVNTGDVIAGAMGSAKRIDYTSIGDAVNLGARLEGTNKVYGTLAIISEFTYAIVKDDVITRELDLIKVKGKNKPVRIYELIDLTITGQEKIDAYLKSLEEKELQKKTKKKKLFGIFSV